ncbi:uncharacterized protein BKA55DRAFT_574628, partial [Fusarium redolens]
MELMALTYIITIAIILATVTTYTSLQFTPNVPAAITEETCIYGMNQSINQKQASGHWEEKFMIIDTKTETYTPLNQV